MDITAPFSIIRAAAVHLNSGVININNNGGLTINQSGSASAMTNSGTIHLAGGDFAFNQPADGVFTSTGTIQIESGRTLRVNGGTFNYPSGTVGGGGTVALTSTVANWSANFSTAATGLQLTGAVLNGPGTITNDTGQTLIISSTAIHAPLVNQGTMVVDGGSGIAGSFSAQSGSVLRVQGDCSYGNGALTVSGGFVNNGTIELTSVGCGYSAALTVNSGTLVNAAGGSIKALTGATGPRYLYAQLDNQGTMDVAAPFSIIRAAAVHLNSGTININNNGGLTINQSGSASAMTNSGTIH